MSKELPDYVGYAMYKMLSATEEDDLPKTMEEAIEWVLEREPHAVCIESLMASDKFMEGYWESYAEISKKLRKAYRETWKCGARIRARAEELLEIIKDGH